MRRSDISDGSEAVQWVIGTHDLFWLSRDAPATLSFYSTKLGFGEDWRYEEEGRLRIVQVSRAGCELILSDQWPEEAGRGLLFIELNQEDLDRLLFESKERGLDVKSGWWRYDLTVIE